jgi:hypothetical protein
MDQGVRGGGNLIELFAIASNAAGTSEIKLVKVIKSDWTLNDDGSWEIPLDQTQDTEALTTFLKDYGPVAGVSQSEEEGYEYEDSTTEGGGTGTTDTSKYLAAVGYGGKGATKRKLWIGIVVVGPGSGSYTQESKKSTKPKLSLRSVKAPADTTIAQAKFDHGTTTAFRVTAPTTHTIEEGSYGEVVWMTFPTTAP